MDVCAGGLRCDVWRSREVSFINRSWHNDRGGRNDIVWREREKARPGNFQSTCSISWWCWKRPGVWRWGYVSGEVLVLSEKAACAVWLTVLYWWLRRCAETGGWKEQWRKDGWDITHLLFGRVADLPAFLLGAKCCERSSAGGFLDEEATVGSMGQARVKSVAKMRRGMSPQSGLKVVSYWDGFGVCTMWRQSYPCCWSLTLLPVNFFSSDCM